MNKHGLPPRILEALERCVVILGATAIGLLLLATLKSQVARAAEFPAQIGAGTLLFDNGVGFDAAAPLSTDVRISIAGVVARVSIAQRFRNPGATHVEAVYALPLPDDAAVDRLSMQIGERLIEGEIHEREQAQQIYTQARDAGQRASLVAQSTPNLFKTAVANIGPGESIDITIEYLQTARYDDGELSLRLPLTLTPRYGSDETALPQLAGVMRRSTTHRETHNEATIRVVLAPGMPLREVGSRAHDVRVTRDTGAGHYVLETLEPRVPMDRDFVVAWRPEVGSTPAVAALTETRDGTTYALLMILPPAAQAQAYRSQPRELIYVIDTSGSMAGQSIEQAKSALAAALGRLSGADRFNVFQFNSTTSSLYRTPVPLTAESYADALRYVERLTADGGTEMDAAIRAALAQPATPGYLRQVIFLTDGGVANETELFTSIKQNLGDARLFTIGIGAAPNSHFMRKAAQFGRGTYTHIGDAAAVAGSMQALFDKLERVALTDVLVDWPDAVELYPLQVPDLYAGEPIVITASFAARTSGPLAVETSGTSGGAAWSQSIVANGESLPGIAALWARRKIEYLIDSRVDGVDESLIRKLVVEVALEHGLVTPYTSLVAVDKTPARAAGVPLDGSTVANMRPSGAVYASLPQTASSAPLYRWLGALLIAAALAIYARWPRFT